MSSANQTKKTKPFSETLFEKMILINPAVKDMEFYEFQYGLDNLIPVDGWESVVIDENEDLINCINQIGFYEKIQLKPRINGQIVLDKNIVHLTNTLFVGIVSGKYDLAPFLIGL